MGAEISVASAVACGVVLGTGLLLAVADAERVADAVGATGKLVAGSVDTVSVTETDGEAEGTTVGWGEMGGAAAGKILGLAKIQAVKTKTNTMLAKKSGRKSDFFCGFGFNFDVAESDCEIGALGKALGLDA